MSIINRERITKSLAILSLGSLIYLSTLALSEKYVAIPHLTNTCIQTITTMKKKYNSHLGDLADIAAEQGAQLGALIDENAALKLQLQEQQKTCPQLEPK